MEPTHKSTCPPATLQKMQASLHSRRLADRLRSVAQLAECGTSEAQLILIQALQNDMWQVRMEAAQELGKAQVLDAIPELIILLRDTQAEVREFAALYGLGRLGVAAVPVLKKALHSNDEETRVGAARALGRIASRKAIFALIRATRDQSADVRRFAIEALGIIGDARTVPTILPFARDSNADIRYAAMFALGQLGDPEGQAALIAGSLDEDESVRRMANIGLSNLTGSQA